MKIQQYLSKWKGNTEFRFVCTFMVLLMIGQAVYFFSQAMTENVIVEKMHVAVSVKLINWITPDESVAQSGKDIYNNDTRMTVACGCDGMDGILMVVSAMLAFPMLLRAKILGVVLGTIIVYMTNLLRIITLYFFLRFWPGWFEFMHVYMGQFMVIFAGGLFFLFWVNQFGKSAKTPA